MRNTASPQVTVQRAKQWRQGLVAKTIFIAQKMWTLLVERVKVVECTPN